MRVKNEVMYWGGKSGGHVLPRLVQKVADGKKHLNYVLSWKVKSGYSLKRCVISLVSPA